MPLKKIYEELVETQFVENYCKQILINREIPIEEVIQYCYLQVFEYLYKNQDKIRNIYLQKGINGVRAIASGIIHRQLISKNSPFHFQYIRKTTSNILQKRTNDKKEQWNEIDGWSEFNTKQQEKIEDNFQTLKEDFDADTESEAIQTFKHLSDLEQSILLTYIEKKTYTETAKALNVSAPVIRKTIEKIRDKFKKMYDTVI